MHNGHAYVGVASLCDTPLVQGKLLRVDLATHQIANTWNVVPDGEVGGTIWTTPVVDTARNTVFVTTGDRKLPGFDRDQQHAEALVALDATTLAIKGYWSLSVSDPTPDADWGTSSTLFQGQPRPRSGFGGEQERHPLRLPARRRLRGAGLVAALGGGRRGLGSRRRGRLLERLVRRPAALLRWRSTTIGGNTYEGSVRALDPATGAI